MKVFLLGGYGKVGMPVIDMLAKSDLVTEITVAGRDRNSAEKAAAAAGKKAAAVAVDGKDEKGLAALLADYDLLVNAATAKTSLPAARAAIRTYTDYCDATTFGSTIDEMTALSAEAETAGITGVVATGISPCISNLMGVHAARQLDDVLQLQRGAAGVVDFQTARELSPQKWIDEPAKCLSALPEFEGFVKFMFKMMQKYESRKVIEYGDGGWTEIDPIKAGLRVPLPQGGTASSHPFISTEAYWEALPRDFTEPPPVEMWFSAFPPKLDALFRDHALSVRDEHEDPDAAVNSFYESIGESSEQLLELPGNFRPISNAWVRAVGTKSDRAARISCWFSASTCECGGYFLTSAALAAAANMILHGKVKKRGIMTAEKALDPQMFFEETAALLPGFPSGGKLLSESLEWLE